MAQHITGGIVFWSLIAGILPPLLWLWFWLREDAAHPEPRHLLLSTFLAGILSVVPTYYIQQAIAGMVPFQLALAVFWPLTEEIAKLAAAYFVAFKTKFYDEPIDALIYLITAAIGFSSAENFLFLIKPDFSMISFLTANMRFVGATLLHIVTSATIGAALAFTFYKNESTKGTGLIFGLVTATMLHSLFNLSIIKDKGDNILIVFAILWSLAIILMLLFERIKRITNK